MTRLRKGQVVRVEFLDHVEGGQYPYRFVVYGELSCITKESLTVDCWTYAEKAQRDENVKSYTLVRSAVMSVQILTPKETK